MPIRQPGVASRKRLKRGGDNNVEMTTTAAGEASRGQLNGNARRRWRRACALASRVHSARAEDNYTHRWLGGVTSLDVIAQRDADWLRAALTGNHCFSSRPADRPMPVLPSLYP